MRTRIATIQRPVIRDDMWVVVPKCETRSMWDPWRRKLYFFELGIWHSNVISRFEIGLGARSGIQGVFKVIVNLNVMGRSAPTASEIVSTKHPRDSVMSREVVPGFNCR
jgi:hypothetical protein